MSNKFRLSVVAASVLAVSVLASASAFAANYKGEGDYKAMAPAPAMPCMTKSLKDGFYVGIAGGYDSYNVRDGVTDVSAVNYSAYVNPTLAATGWVGGLFAGYGMYFSNAFYLGAEIFANDSAAESNFSSTSSDVVNNVVASFNTKVTATGSYGISLLPGYKLNDSSLLYVRLGYNRAHLKGSESFTVTTAAGTATGGASNSTWQSGFNYGLGLETLIVDNVSLRAEYTHTNYSNFSINNIATGTNTKFSPSDNQFMLGLAYHFA